MPRSDSWAIYSTSLQSRKGEVIDLIQQGRTYRSIAGALSCSVSTVRRALKLWGLSTLAPQRLRSSKRYRPATDYLHNQGPYISSHQLKLKLWREGLKPQHCEECFFSKIGPSGNPAVQLHHINGNRYDNQLHNLQILCPTCHSLTSNYAGLNKGAYD